MSIVKEGNVSSGSNFRLIAVLFFVVFAGWLKIKLHNQSKWHRRFCIVDWDRSVLFFASRPDTRYREWIQLLATVVINDCDLTFVSETNAATNNHLLFHTIEIKTDSKTYGRTFFRVDLPDIQMETQAIISKQIRKTIVTVGFWH